MLRHHSNHGRVAMKCLCTLSRYMYKPNPCTSLVILTLFCLYVKVIVVSSFTYLLTELSPSWEAANSAATEELPRILRNPKVHQSPAAVTIGVVHGDWRQQCDGRAQFVRCVALAIETGRSWPHRPWQICVTVRPSGVLACNYVIGTWHVLAHWLTYTLPCSNKVKLSL
jgi:hypothetical protein